MEGEPNHTTARTFCPAQKPLGPHALIALRVIGPHTKSPRMERSAVYPALLARRPAAGRALPEPAHRGDCLTIRRPALHHALKIHGPRGLPPNLSTARTLVRLRSRGPHPFRLRRRGPHLLSPERSKARTTLSALGDHGPHREKPSTSPARSGMRPTVSRPTTLEAQCIGGPHVLSPNISRPAGEKP